MCATTSGEKTVILLAKLHIEHSLIVVVLLLLLPLFVVVVVVATGTLADDTEEARVSNPSGIVEIRWRPHLERARQDECNDVYISLLHN